MASTTSVTGRRLKLVLSMPVHVLYRLLRPESNVKNSGVVVVADASYGVLL